MLSIWLNSLWGHCCQQNLLATVNVINCIYFIHCSLCDYSSLDYSLWWWSILIPSLQLMPPWLEVRAMKAWQAQRCLRSSVSGLCSFFASLTSSTSSALSSVTLTEQLLEFMHQLPAFANMTMSVRRELCAVMVFAVVERAGTIVLNDGEEVCKSKFMFQSLRKPKL